MNQKLKYLLCICSFVAYQLMAQTTDKYRHWLSLGYGQNKILSDEKHSFFTRPFPIDKCHKQNISLLYNARLKTGKKLFLNGSMGLNLNLYRFNLDNELDELSGFDFNWPMGAFNLGIQNSFSLGIKLLDRKKIVVTAQYGINTSGTVISNIGNSTYWYSSKSGIDTAQIEFVYPRNSQYYLRVYSELMLQVKPYRLSLGVKRFSAQTPEDISVSYNIWVNDKLSFMGNFRDVHNLYQFYLAYHFK